MSEKKIQIVVWKTKVNFEEIYTPYYSDVTENNTERTILDFVGKETLTVIVSGLIDLLGTSIAIFEKTEITLLECLIPVDVNWWIVHQENYAIPKIIK